MFFLSRETKVYKAKLYVRMKKNYWCPLKLSSPIWLFIFLGQPIY